MLLVKLVVVERDRLTSQRSRFVCGFPNFSCVMPNNEVKLYFSVAKCVDLGAKYHAGVVKFIE